MKKFVIYLLLLLVAGQASAATESYMDIAYDSYFDTGFKATADTKVVMRMSLAKPGSTNAFFGICNGYGFEVYEGHFRSWVNNSTYDASDGLYVNEADYELTYTVDSYTVYAKPQGDATSHRFCYHSQNGVSSNFLMSYSMWIGATRKINGDFHVGGSCNLYEFSIYEQNVLVHHYVPGQFDGNPILYDTKTCSILNLVQNGATTTTMHPINCKHKYVKIEQDNGVYKAHCYQCDQKLTMADWTKAREEESSSVSVIDPYLDTALPADSAGYAQTVIMSTSGNILTQCMFNEKATDGTQVDYSSGSSSITLELPKTDTLQTYYTASLVCSTSNSGDTDYVWVPKAILVKPFHTLAAFTAEQQTNPDKTTGVMNPKTKLRVAINNPKIEDLMSTDQIQLQRSYYPDFSNYSTVSSVSIEADNFTAESGTNKGWYEYTDEDEGATYSTQHPKQVLCQRANEIDASTLTETEKTMLRAFYTGWDRAVYYRAVRSTASSLWGDTVANYTRVDTIHTFKMLPKVTDVAVSKQEDWDEDKNVKVTVFMANPYPWEYNSQLDSVKVMAALNNNVSRRYVWDENAQIKVERYCTDGDLKQKYATKTYTISGSDVTWDNTLHGWTAVLDDQQSYAGIHYYYKAIVDTLTSDIPVCLNNDYYSSSEDDADKCYSQKSALINNFTATQGDQQHQGQCYLSWEISSELDTELQLGRRIYNGKNTDWTYLKLDNSATQYVDETARPGIVYEYSLTATAEYIQEKITTTKEALGWCPYYGTIQGKVLMTDGTAMAGVEVTITRDKLIDIEDVYDKNGNLLMKGLHEGLNANTRPQAAVEGTTVVVDSLRDGFKMTVYTDEDGYFTCDSLPYDSLGAAYTVQPQFGNCSFLYNKQVQSAVLTLGLNTCDYNIEFTNATCYRYSGRVLYANSTVPVRDATFRINYCNIQGEATSTHEVRNSKSEPVKTDQSGNFSFYVPKTNLSIQVYKYGHKFCSDGLIDLGNNVQHEYVFTPDKDKEFTLQDSTKVRLIGRIRGGDLGEETIGLGKSTNNLGDDMTMVLMLEGDNTAQIVYKEDDPDNTTIETTAYIPLLNEQNISLNVDSTEVTYEKRRIVVKPNVKTGEFVVDLFPAKYKVTQLSATGYSTLFSASEGFEVLDLTNAVDTTYNVGEMTTKDAENNEIKLDVNLAYNSSYTRVFHNPVTVTYTQYNKGKYNQKLGTETFTVKNLSNESVKIPTLTANAAGDTVTYYFGYPVFESGESYTLQIRAHEDYYYNGLTNTKPDMIYLNHGTLKWNNGLEQNNQEKQCSIDETGTAYLTVTPSNTVFSDNGDDALRELTMSVLLDGYYYQADPLKAYVTGQKASGTVPVSINSDIKLLDVLRDPPGANSSASIAKGATYSWTHNVDFALNLTFNLTMTRGTNYTGVTAATVGAVAAPTGTGTYSGSVIGTINQTSTSKQTVFPFPLASFSVSRHATYNMTTTETISTSTSNRYTGAMSDVYMGTVNTLECSKTTCFSIIDSLTYELSKSAVTLIKKGETESGKPVYLVISKKLAIGSGIDRTFNYSQRHILGVVIPELIETRNQMLYTGSKESVQAVANTTNKAVYWSTVEKDDDNFGLGGYYEMVQPTSWPSDTIVADRVNECNTMVNNWMHVIYQNEAEKVNAIMTTPFKRYSLSDAPVTYSEASSGYDTGGIIDGGVGGFSFQKGTWASSLNESISGNHKEGINNGTSSDNILTKETFESLQKLAKDAAKDSSDVIVNVGTTAFKLSYKIGLDLSFSNNQTATATKNRTVSYTMSMADNSYLDVNVYRVSARNNNIGESSWIAQSTKSTSVNKTDEFSQNRPADFIYSVRGGGTRHPYIPADSTFFYTNLATGKPFELNVATAKIDNPRITIKNPVVNNIAQDEKATFEVVLSNETEMASGVSNLNPSGFILVSDDDHNPYGAKLTMDGEPLTEGRTFYINPGQSVTKTLEVERGRGYDFDNMMLKFNDSSYSLSDKAYFSVRYQPTSTPVNLSLPHDQWIMNTLAAHDTSGYYIPVQIDGYDVNYDNFDHIELQYKKDTEGSDQWVNLCSFYASDSLYALASGTKQMMDLQAGKITNFPFYGEKDPVEMKYNLRAVSFCRLGTSYVTRSSSVITGTKDTRIPAVFGNASPTSGILTYEDALQLNFNEPIAYNYLDKTSNFQVWGYTNKTDIAQSNTLYFPGEMNQDASTSVTRNLCQRDFTVEMYVKADAIGNDMVLFSHGSNNSSVAFGVTKDNRFFARVKGNMVYSESLDNYPLTSTLCHVGMIFHKGGNYKSSVEFFYNTKILENSSESTVDNYTSSGLIHLGVDGYRTGVYPFKGEMVDVRLWSKALDEEEIVAYKDKKLTGYEQNLMAYWPLSESAGSTATDIAHAANLTLTGTSWSNVSGYSLRTINKPIHLNATKICANATSDNSVCFWFRVESLDETAKRAPLMLSGGDYEANKLFVGFQGDSLILESDTVSFYLAKRSSMADQAWHHFAMTVDRSLNIFTAYIDNEIVAQDMASLIDAMPSNSLTLGDASMVANFDDFSQWNLALPKVYLNTFYNALLKGSEMGLNAYLPFTYRAKNSSGTMADNFSPYDESYDQTLGKVVRNDDHKLVMDAETENMDNNQHAPLRQAAELENLDFDWTSTDNALQINLKAQDISINKQNVFLTVRSVEDLNGNSMASPYMWTVFVDKNVLRWDNRSVVEVSVPYGESTSVRLPYRNLCGKTMSYKVEKEATWMTIDKTLGSLQAEEETYLTATFDAGITPGVYTDVIYLVDENGLTDPVTLQLTVEAAQPTWDVDLTKYDRTMNLMAEVKLLNGSNNYVLDTDSEDIVAAFIGGQCVGLSHITTDNVNGSYLYMTIYGNATIAKNAESIGFLLWRKTTGETCALYCNSMDSSDKDAYYITFKTDSAVGCPPNEPLVFYTGDYREQNITLNSGWNWVSLNVNPVELMGYSGLIIDANGLFSNGDIIKHVEQNTKYAQYDALHKKWVGTLTEAECKKVYQVYVKNGGEYKMLGSLVSDEQMTFAIQKGWNELPYLLQYSETIEEALADFQIGDKASDGDIIKGLNEFAVASTAKNAWVGSLRYMRPGHGYYLMHKGEATSFSYKESNLNNTALANTSSARQQVQSHSTSMPVIATFANDVEVEDGDQLAAYVGEELVGRASLTRVDDSESLYFLNVNADEGDVITFAQERDGEVIARTSRKVGYNQNSVVGSLEEPYAVSFTDTNESTGYYDLQGRRLPDGYKPVQHGVYIKDGKKVTK